MAKLRAPYFPFYPEDFMHGCRISGMSPEQVGAYIYMLCLEWLNRGPLEDDARKLAMGMGWDIRLVRRLVNEVVSIGKYDRANGRLTNQRMEEEIAKFCRKMQAKLAAAGNDLPSSSGVANEQLPGSSDIANQHLFKNANEINGNGVVATCEDPSTHARARSEVDTDSEKKDFPPTPRGGEEGKVDDFGLTSPPTAAEKKAAKRAVEKAMRRRTAHEALVVFNKAAKHFGFQPISEASATEARLVKLEGRLNDIGGLENFKRALRAIGEDDWLMGRIEKSGRKPFKLTFEHLLSTRSGMGDVLARLLDSASAPANEDQGLKPNWWCGRETAIREYPVEWWHSMIASCANGTWPVDRLGPGPWEGEACLVPKAVIAELGLEAKYPNPHEADAGTPAA
jgi:uncharacterized protein YdaU (DUF1376 family)